MNDLSENKVVLTDEKYKYVRSDLATWYICLVIKLILAPLVIFLVIPTKWSFPVFLWVLSGGTIAFILKIIMWFILPFVLLSAICAVHEFQTTAQNSLDRDFLGFDKGAWHILEIFPGKSMRLAHREVRRYRRQKRLQEKEHKKKR